MQFYSDPTREQDPRFSPDSEVFYVGLGSRHEHFADDNDSPKPVPPGFYWHTFLANGEPGDPIGPFDTEALAIADCRDGVA